LLLVNGLVSSNHYEIREHIVLFYNRLFTDQFSWRPKLDGLAFDSIDVEDSTWLERPFEEIEVLEVVKGKHRDKASDPNGFYYGFLSSVVGCD
jgi:hypothetical protein